MSYLSFIKSLIFPFDNTNVTLINVFVFETYRLIGR